MILQACLTALHRRRTAPPVTVSLPSYLSSAAINQWVQVPNGNISAAGVAPSPSPGGSGVSGVTDAWGCATVRQSSGHLILNGGGHGDYYGNENYALDLMSESPAWSRVWGPTPNGSMDTTAGVYYHPDGNPKSDHTYYNLWYDTVNDRLMRVFTGDPPNANNSRDVNSWTWGAANWNPEGTHPDCPYGTYDGGKCQNYATGDLYFWGNTNNAIWTRSTNTWTTANGNNTLSALNNATAYDPVRGCVWCVAGTGLSSGQVFKWTLPNTFTSVSVTGGSSGITTSVSAGAFYCPDTDKVYIYTGAGALYVFDPAALTINQVSTTGTAPSSNSTYGNNTGTLGKLCYVSLFKGLALKPAWNSPTFAMRLAA